MSAKLKNSNEGFTIIEVLIVLAIAGLILLIVFLAVPALQRNARNTNRKNDVSAVLSGLTESASNNSGALPTNCTGTSTVTWTGANGANNDTKMGYYNATCGVGSTGNGHVDLKTAPAGNATALNGTTKDYIVVAEGDQCTPANGAKAGSANSVAILYEIETSGGFTSQCEQS